MAAATYDLVATSWTSAGDAMPLRTGERSPLPLQRRMAAARAAGFRGFGLNHADLVQARDAIGLDGIAEQLQRHQFTHFEVEFLDYWWTTGAQRAASDRLREDLLTAGSALGAKLVKVGVGFAGETYDPDTLRTEFARLAGEAADANIKIALEATAFSMIPELAVAVRLIADVDHPNAGLLIDIWHVYRSGLDYQKMTQILPAEFLFAVELDDGAREQIGTGHQDTFDRRLLCGDGEFDVTAFVAAIRKIGYHGPWGVEHMSMQSRATPFEDVLRQAHDAATRCLRAEPGSPPGAPPAVPLSAPPLRKRDG